MLVFGNKPRFFDLMDNGRQHFADFLGRYAYVRRIQCFFD